MVLVESLAATGIGQRFGGLQLPLAAGDAASE
jgi:hypothetical protein